MIERETFVWVYTCFLAQRTNTHAAIVKWIRIHRLQTVLLVFHIICYMQTFKWFWATRKNKKTNLTVLIYSMMWALLFFLSGASEGSVWQLDISPRAWTAAGRRGASGRPARGRVAPESRVPIESVTTQCELCLSAVLQNADKLSYFQPILILNPGRIRLNYELIKWAKYTQKITDPEYEIYHIWPC